LRSDPSDFVIETDLLTKRYGEVIAVDALSLRVPRGGVFGFLGPNGSGKTTTMGMLLGLVHPTSGEARIFGDPARHPAPLRRVGAMVETPTFYPYLSGRANLRYFQAVGRRGSPADIERLLTLVDLVKRADSKFATYSLGMKQRLWVACALLGDPELVFLDEPTNGLDPAGVVEVRELILQLGTGGRTVVLSSHMLAETELVCDNVAVLSRGRLIAQGTGVRATRVFDALPRRAGADAHAVDTRGVHPGAAVHRCGRDPRRGRPPPAGGDAGTAVADGRGRTSGSTSSWVCSRSPSRTGVW
jgi:ABC-type multidrug transport system ATPase subunit